MKNAGDFGFDRWPLNLQLFAEGEGGEGGGSGDGGEGGGSGARTFTQADVDELIKKRIARERKDLEQRLKEEREAGYKEGEESARLSEDERGKRKREADEKAAQQREKQLSDREREVTRRELRAEAIEQLAERGLPRDLEALLDYTDAEKRDASLDSVEKIFRAAVQSGVEDRLRGGGEPGGSGGKKTPPDTDKLSDAEYYAQLKKG